MKILNRAAPMAVLATTLSGWAHRLRCSARTALSRETRTATRSKCLLWKDTWALDKGDGATYAATYIVDGQFGAGANVTKGREVLSKLVVRPPAAGELARPPLYHMELNHCIQFAGQGPRPVSRVLPDISARWVVTCRRGLLPPARTSTRWSASRARGC